MIDFHLGKALDGAEGPLLLDVKGRIPAGQIIGLSGPSGAGKTSFLRLLAGLLPADQGYLYVDGQCWLDVSKKAFHPVARRQVGMVTQDYALFPNMSILQQLRYAAPGSTPDQQLEALLHTLELDALKDHRPATLSGGQQQRVALARSLAQQPRLLLLDEPFAALDGRLRQKTITLVQEHLRTHGITAVIVSHQITDLRQLADDIWEMQAGKIVQQATARDFRLPHTKTRLAGWITRLQAMPDHQLVDLRINQQIVTISVPTDLSLRVGEWLEWEV